MQGVQYGQKIISDLPTVTVRPGREVPLRAGHPWIFSNAIGRAGKEKAGALVGVYAAGGEFLGIGMWNPATTIRVRMIRGLCSAPTADFFLERFRELDVLKRGVIPPETTGYRLVHGDADGLPGLIVDRYDVALVFQIHTAGMDRLRREIVEGLSRLYQPAIVVERSDVPARQQEGLSDAPVIVHAGDVPEPVCFKERGLNFAVDILGGQKTGFFLDQRESRQYAASLSAGKRVLNLFCYSAAASVYALRAGARQVVSVDASAPALALAERNLAVNGFPPDNRRVSLLCRDVFDYVRQARAQSACFDVIICDPPAFAKSQPAVAAALKAYVRLNAACFQLLTRGGILISSSCSGRVSWSDFFDVLRISAGGAGRQVRILARLGQPADHTDLLVFPEGRYLKTVVMEVLSGGLSGETGSDGKGHATGK